MVQFSVLREELVSRAVVIFDVGGDGPSYITVWKLEVQSEADKSWKIEAKSGRLEAEDIQIGWCG